MSPRERLFALEQFGIKLGLDNSTALLDALNRPDRAYRIVHIAGTNGKGSVTAMVERGLRAAGYRTGRYTSPHLVDIEERIAIDGRPVARDEFDRVAAVVLERADGLRERAILPALPTFFEATTAMALDIFRRHAIDVAVVEVGLGGRFDATNVVSPIVTAITSIAMDHRQHLGDSLSRIAFEKAGIIKPGVPVVIGALSEEARGVIEEVARNRAAPLVPAAPAASGTPVALALAGAHQLDNAAIAVATLRACARAGLGVQREHLVTALTDVEWPARLEWLRLDCSRAKEAKASKEHEAGAVCEVLVDAAHNPAGADTLARYVRETAGPLPLVIGIAQDKDIDGIVRALAPATAYWVATQADSPRAMPAAALAARAAAVRPEMPIDVEADVEAALARAWAVGSRVVIAGSILLVGPIRARLMARGANPVRYPSRAGPFLLD